VTVIQLETKFFDILQVPPTVADPVLENEARISGFWDATLGTVQALQLSSSLIRLRFIAPFWAQDKANFELRLSGTSIGPISSLDGFLTALDESLTTGRITGLTAVRDGAAILGISFAANQFRLQSGNDIFTVTGQLPSHFDSFVDFGARISDIGHLDTMTVGERAALFTALGQYAITGLSYTDNGRSIFSFQASGTAMTLAMGGFVLSAAGTMPISVGAAAEAFYQITTQSEAGTLDLSTISTLHLDSLTLSTTAGQTLFTATGITAEDPSFSYLGRSYSEMLIGDDWTETLAGATGNTASILSGLDGNDVLLAYAGNDVIFGGKGDDRIFAGDGHDLIVGGLGFDRATYVTTNNLTIDLRKTVGQATGQGFDTLIGVEGIDGASGNDTIHGSAGDNWLVGNAGHDLLEGDAGNDMLEGWQGNDTLVGMRGDDTLWGGAGADVFRFYATNGVFPAEFDEILDYNPAQDRIALTNIGGTAPWAGMTKAQFLASYATLDHGDVILHISPGQTLFIEGNYTSVNQIANGLVLL
jgi:Ca2+-binding RTX toxin-like protein